MKSIKKILGIIFNKFKYPIVRQYDQIDCGPASLLSILKYYGGNSNLVHIRELCQVDSKGSTMLGLATAAKQLGFDAYGATGEYDQLLQEKMPCIAHIVLENGLNHFVVLYKTTRTKVLIGDPGRGLYKLAKKQFLDTWKKQAVLLLEPKTTIFNSVTSNWLNWMIRHLKKYDSWIYQTLFLGIVYTLLGLLTAIFIQWLIDRFIPEKNYTKIIYTGLFLFFLLTIKAGAGFFRQRFLIILNKKMSIDINSEFLSHIFKIPKRFFDTRKTGDITARINDGLMIQQAILLIMNTTIIDSLVIIGSFILMFYLAQTLAWLSILMVPIYGASLLLQVNKLKVQQNEVMKGHSIVESSYIDSLQGIDDILGFNASKAFARLNITLFEFFQSRIVKLGYTRTNLSFSAELSGTILIITILTTGSIMVINNKILLGHMVAAYSLLGTILPSINRLVEANIAFQSANIAAQRLRDILLVQTEKNEGKLPFYLKKELSLSQAHFSWSTKNTLFKGIDVSLIKGKITALWGKSGAGKSTLTQILQRKYLLDHGELKVDCTPATEFDLFDYRKNIAIIPQNIKIFNGTIAENILIGREIKSLEEITFKINQIDLAPFLTRFEYGLFTLIGEEGQKLSGGEKKILSLIRALWQSPEVLIIDEGLNSIDFELEHLFFSIIKKYSKNHVVLIISHNPKIILQADFIYLLKDGVIIESGEPYKLMKTTNSYFNQLLISQNINNMESFNEFKYNCA